MIDSAPLMAQIRTILHKHEYMVPEHPVMIMRAAQPGWSEGDNPLPDGALLALRKEQCRARPSYRVGHWGDHLATL